MMGATKRKFCLILTNLLSMFISRGSYSDVAAEGNFKLEERESQMSILTLEHGEALTHCNK